MRVDSELMLIRLDYIQIILVTYESARICVFENIY